MFFDQLEEENFGEILVATRQSTNFRVSPSPLNKFCRLTFHALRCVLFPSGHLRPSKMFDYPCGLQFSLFALTCNYLVLKKSNGRRNIETVSLKYLPPPPPRPPPLPDNLSGIVYLLFLCNTRGYSNRHVSPTTTTSSSCSPTIRLLSVTRLSSFYLEFTAFMHL